MFDLRPLPADDEEMVPQKSERPPSRYMCIQDVQNLYDVRMIPAERLRCGRRREDPEASDRLDVEVFFRRMRDAPEAVIPREAVSHRKRNGDGI
jgi:hypothetical protein